MSLIHSAITALEEQSRAHGRDVGEQARVQQSAPISVASTVRPARLTWLIAIAGAVMVTGGIATVWMAQAQLQQAPVLPMQATANLVEEAPAVATPTASLAAPASVAIPDRERTSRSDLEESVSAHAGTAILSVPVAGVTDPAAAAPPAVAPVSHTRSIIQAAAHKSARAVGTAPVSRTAPASMQAKSHGESIAASTQATSDSIDRTAAGIRHAIDARRYDDAAALLQELGRQLPPESITLLRLRAWHALRSDDIQTSVLLYRRIVERLPDDESASINLALSYWKLGQQAEARQLISALAERRPESEAVRQALQQFGAQS